MNVIALTVLVSLVLVALFVALFAHQTRHRSEIVSEQDALLPFGEETPTPATKPKPPSSAESKP